ncbi:MAG TPA: hypothetical protein VMD27_12585 [Candidatus Aquilonibacter sp.]|nr:hypothetical protein [Candidatus Aquilonibacter sp.]
MDYAFAAAPEKQIFCYGGATNRGKERDGRYFENILKDSGFSSVSTVRGQLGLRRKISLSIQGWQRGFVAAQPGQRPPIGCAAHLNAWVKT